MCDYASYLFDLDQECNVLVFVIIKLILTYLIHHYMLVKLNPNLSKLRSIHISADHMGSEWASVSEQRLTTALTICSHIWCVDDEFCMPCVCVQCACSMGWLYQPAVSVVSGVTEC